MGTSPTEPFRFSLNFPPTSNHKKLIKMPKGSGLTKPMKLSADLAEVVGKKEAIRAECIKQLWAYKKEQPPRPRKQAILQPRQKDGKGFRIRPHSCLRYGQVPLSSLVSHCLNNAFEQLAHTLIHGP